MQVQREHTVAWSCTEEERVAWVPSEGTAHTGTDRYVASHHAGGQKPGGRGSMRTGLVRAESSSSLGLGKPPSPQRLGAQLAHCGFWRGLRWPRPELRDNQHTQTCSPAQAPPRRGLVGRPQLSHCPHSDSAPGHSYPCQVHRKVQGSSWWPQGSPCHRPSDRHIRGTGDSALFFCLLPAVARK